MLDATSHPKTTQTQNLLGFRVFHPPNPPIYGGFLFFFSRVFNPGQPLCWTCEAEGKRLWGVPRDSQFWVDFFGNYERDSRFFCAFEISRLLGLLSKASGVSSLLVAGRPSLPGGPHCREALVAGRPSLPGGPRCREVRVWPH